MHIRIHYNKLISLKILLWKVDFLRVTIQYMYNKEQNKKNIIAISIDDNSDNNN